MIQQVKKSKLKKTVAIYLALMILLETLQPMRMYALTSGPTQPEFNAFTPIGTSDMVNLSTGDFNYNIPIMDVGGYPLNLAYNSGITMDQEASWVGLGWNLNVGQISRQVRGLPDDFRGDEIRYENDLKDNITIGTNFNLSPALLGNDSPFSLGLGVQFNNYEGITFKPSIGISYSIAGVAQVGCDLTGAVGEGATLSPSVSISGKSGYFKSSLGLSAGLSSRKGLENMSMSASASINKGVQRNVDKVTNKVSYSKNTDPNNTQSLGSMGGSLSFNNQSYTPTKRIGFVNKNKTFNATVGGEVFGLEGQVRISGYGSYQTIADSYKDRKVGAYGYENTQYKNGSDGVLDFNRENEKTVNRNTNVLPVTNYTYDIYNIEGQGVSGMFRPFRSQVGYLYNDNVSDIGSSGSFGAELGIGNLVHAGVDFTTSPTTSFTGLWQDKNYALPVFTESSTDKNTPLYETSTFKLVGELDVDPESTIYATKLRTNQALRIQIAGKELNRYALPSYLSKSINGSGIPTYDTLLVNRNIKREGRLLRNQTVQKITNKEADGKFIFANVNAKLHHTAGIKVLQSDGTTYIYGRTAYNTKKVEATFDVSERIGDTMLGLVHYNNDNDGSPRGNQSDHSDRFLNRITTPGFAHTYLITSVLSSDYQDLDDNGPSDKDLGSYTKFGYDTSIKKYNWRVPYGKNMASYSEGLKSSTKDQKGNYIYGEKELAYLNKIETKTHVAFIDFEDRIDAMGVNDELGGQGQGTIAMKRVKSIRLYSKAELTFDSTGNVVDPGIGGIVKPIKTAHFEYDYSLCSSIPSNSEVSKMIGANTNLNKNKGKLTLKKVYFTYRSSNMGKFTPYVFDYGVKYNLDGNPIQNLIDNPNYALKGFDIWGNYNPVTSAPTTSEYPFVKQNQTDADKFTSAWTLKSVTLPSGGKLSVETESDDYKYVQNKKAMQMFKVVGAGNSSIPKLGGNLYSGNTHNKYLYVKVNDANMDSPQFIDKYLSENIDKPIYFKFLLNMTDSSQKKYDYVSGYFEIDPNTFENSNIRSQMNVNADGLVAIPLRFLDMEGGIANSTGVNPISKAGWGFGRTYLNRVVYGMGGAESNFDFVSIVNDLVGSIASMAEIFTGPNQFLQIKGCARDFDPEQSWIRLENPNGKKFGGGLRVKSIKLSDNWDVMNSVPDTNTAEKVIYNEQYGQDYKYDLADGSSSGVATFEPNASPENALVEPFYGSSDGNYAERIGSPRELNYVEKPFGETFFPSPKITYSRVTVSNLNKDNGNNVIKRHATGTVVTEHYTTYDFPTIVDYTNIDLRPDKTQSPIWNMLSVRSVDHLTASQGFSIETNDMDGKIKSEKVFAEGQTTPISRVEYKYNLDSSGRLNNMLTTVNSKGEIKNNLLGVEYDVINDFNESNSVTISSGVHANLATFIIGFFPVFIPIPIPNYARHETILRTATTTKVIHKTGILIEKEAYDLGSRVSTKNLAWDSKSGQVLLTQTINEFDDKYYSFNYPAYWNYANMGLASENIDLKGIFVNHNGFFDISNYILPTFANLSTCFKIGDELMLGDGSKVWVNDYSSDKMKVQLINRDGKIINNSNLPTNLNFKVIRSGNKNQQTATMASVTSMVNPLLDRLGVTATKITDDTFGYIPGATFNPRIVNASAVEYSDDWKSQCENGLPNQKGMIGGQGNPINPFLYNIKGNWRSIKSYAYLTGRNNFETTNRRKTGYFTKFSPFYKINNEVWSPALESNNYDNWTSASQVTMYSPYGVELENKDALERYSSAQYGYNYKLPVAVVTNAQYKEIGFDGFEDYITPSGLKPHFGFSQSPWDGVEITNQKSHTGNNSIAVSPRKKAVFIRKLGGCKQIITPCQAKVIATPLSQTICSGETIGIALTGVVEGTTFSWVEVSSPNISGAKSGSGVEIIDKLNNSQNISGTVTYIITPLLNGCIGTPVTIPILVKQIPETFPDLFKIGDCHLEVTNISYACKDPSTILTWTNDQIGVTGATSGTIAGANLIHDNLTLTGTSTGTVKYTITTSVNGCPEIGSSSYTIKIYPCQ